MVNYLVVPTFGRSAGRSLRSLWHHKLRRSRSTRWSVCFRRSSGWWPLRRRWHFYDCFCVRSRLIHIYHKNKLSKSTYNSQKDNSPMARKLTFDNDDHKWQVTLTMTVLSRLVAGTIRFGLGSKKIKLILSIFLNIFKINSFFVLI